jgi:hypothetical protein
MSSLDHSTLSEIQSLDIKINHFIHIDIEDSFYVSPSMDKFLSAGVKTVSATLDTNASCVEKYNDSLDSFDKRGIQRDLMWMLNGIIINVETPIRFASEDKNGWCTSNKNNTVNFWFHGETYEIALMKAKNHIEKFHKKTIDLDLFPKSNILKKMKDFIKL